MFNKSYNYDGMLEESFGGQYWHWWWVAHEWRFAVPFYRLHAYLSSLLDAVPRGRYADFNAYARRVLPQAIFLDVVPLNKVRRRAPLSHRFKALRQLNRRRCCCVACQARPDGHMLGVWKDCLHYHMPGPIDWWVIYFQNLLEARDPPTRTQRIGGLDMVEEISRRR